MRRNHEIKLTVTTQELETIQIAAQEAGLSVAGFLRASGLSQNINTPITKETRNALRTFSTNINQIAYYANISRQAPLLQAVEQLRDEARRIVKMIIELAGRHGHQ